MPEEKPKNFDRIVEFRERYAMLTSLNDDEIRRISMREEKWPFPIGEQYIDLEQPKKGVQLFNGSSKVSSETVIPKSTVPEKIWVKLCKIILNPGSGIE